MKSDLENVIFNKQILKTGILKNKRYFSQLSSMISMKAVHKRKTQVIEKQPEKTIKQEINKEADLIKEIKLEELPQSFENINKIEEIKLNDIFYYQEIAYKKMLAKYGPYIEKYNSKLDIKISDSNNELPKKYYVYLTNNILQHKRCRLYMRFKDFQIINDDETEFFIKYYTRMETKITMTYLLDCIYNNDPTVYNYDIDQAFDIYSVKNDFDFLYKIKYKNLKKFVIKNKKYSELNNILPLLFPNGKEINDLLKNYISKNKSRKVKTRYFKKCIIGEQKNAFGKPKNKKGQKEDEDLSELYNDDSDDEDYYVNYNIFDNQAKFYCKRKKNDSNVTEGEKIIDKITNFDENKNKNNNSKNKDKKPIKIDSPIINNKNTDIKNEELKTSASNNNNITIMKY